MTKRFQCRIVLVRAMLVIPISGLMYLGGFELFTGNKIGALICWTASGWLALALPLLTWLISNRIWPRRSEP